jgi:phosphatidylcholine synthase
VLTFAPVNFLHPVRVKRLRPYQSDDLLRLVRLRHRRAAAGAGIGLAGADWYRATGIYLFCIGAVMQWRPDLGRRE